MLHLDPGESIVLEIRKHWFVFVSEGFFFLMAALVPLVGERIISSLTSINLPVSGNESGLLMFLYAIWLLMLWISFFAQWTNYYLDVWYITEKRIIDVEQRRMFSRSVTSLRFDRIQDISIDVKGLVATFLDIGDIRVQTAAEDSADFFMRQADSPDRVRNFIFSQHNKVSESSQKIEIVSNKHDMENPTQGV